MLKGFLEKIEQMTAVAIREQDGRPYSTKTIFPILEPTAPNLDVHTLTGIADYLKENPDALDLAKIIVQVLDPETVEVRSTIFGNFRQRENLMTAQTSHDAFHFGQWMDCENFIIALQARFCITETVGNILKIVGNITEGTTRNHTDDGIAQQVTVKAGITRVAEVPVPNPVTLAPYRTFIEVEQPASQFVLRMRAGSGNDKPTCSLHEADGGAWKIQAIQNVAAWLKGNLPEGVTIIA